MWIISFLSLFEFATTLPLPYALAFLFAWKACGIQPPPPREYNCTPWIGRQNSNHWTTRKVPGLQFLHKYFREELLRLTVSEVTLTETPHTGQAP